MDISYPSAASSVVGFSLGGEAILGKSTTGGMAFSRLYISHFCFWGAARLPCRGGRIGEI